MSDLYSSICISSVKASALKLAGIEIPENIENPNPVITALAEKKLGSKSVDRIVIYNPDAVALWIYQKYTEMFTKAALCSDIALPMLSVMPSVTPVCFASMYSGVMPDIHGIKKYEKPVLSVNTIFDSYIKAGKKA
ncbi:MAG: alkaline phosphatase family protein, partial [Ruminococcaceae bacterium]|nr:alkaline phosphatase family protein [Oscillospiraceae bacterium]